MYPTRLYVPINICELNLILENTVAQPNQSSKSDIWGKGKTSNCVFEFKAGKSTHIQSSPVFLRMNSIGAQ